MKLFRFVGIIAAASGCVFFTSNQISAQQGASSASLSRTREQARQQSNNPSSSAPRRGASLPSSRRAHGQSVANQSYGATWENDRSDNAAANFVLPDEIAVEEFVNYHRHRLPMPKVGQAVALDARWGNDKISLAQPTAVLQVGFTTAEANDRDDLPPVNLSLVIDKSGSMQAADKMTRVKQALRTMIGRLRPDDIVSIVAFDSNAEVLFPAAFVNDGRALTRAIDRIQPDGSTNLNAGLQLGYREALKNFDKAATNRVILLTDGIANVGVTTPGEIAAGSLSFNERGIDLSTIGVGSDLDNDLLRTLAKSGRGLYHFVHENEDIEKVFVSEAQSLMSPVARDVRLTIGYDERNFEIEKVFGYEPRFSRNQVEIPLENMNNGLTAVALLRFRARGDLNFLRAGLLVRLSYYDLKQKRTVEQTQTVTLDVNDSPRRPRLNNLLADAEVKKNYTIALLADSLARMREQAARGDYRAAGRMVDGAVAAAYENFPNMEDLDILRVLNIVEDYQTKLRAVNRGH